MLNIINALNSAEKVLKLSCSDIEINVSFVSRLQIKKLNKQTRNINKVTDVLSYPTLLSEQAEIIDKKYQAQSEYFNTEFFKKCVCYTILYRTTDRIVNKAEWYNVGGYKLNIVPYTISKIISAIPSGYTLDFDRIWRKQELYPSLVKEINRVAQITNEFIQKSSGVIVTEYCKKEETWNKYKTVPCHFSQDFIDDLIPLAIVEDKMKAEIKSEKLSKDLNIEGEIIRLGGEYWRTLIAEGLKRKILSPMEIDLLNIAASSDTPHPKIASPKQAKLIWKIRKKLEDSGVLV